MAVETLQNRMFGAKTVSLGAFITPGANGGQATPDWVGEADDYTDVARAIPNLVDTFSPNAGGRGSKKGKDDDRSGEYYNLLRDIVDNPNLTDSEKEYRVANARRAYKYTLSQSELIAGQKAVQMSEEQTAKGMIDMENRKDEVETYKNDAKFAVENDPTMADKPMEERAEYGKAQRENASTIYTGLMALTIGGADKVNEAATQSVAGAIMSQMPTNLFERSMRGEINAKDENDLTISISRILQDPEKMGIGNTMLPQEAWAVGNRVSQMYFGNLRKMRTDYEKMTIDEQKNFLELRKQATIMGLPTDAQASLALFDYNASNMPELTRQAMLNKLPITKYDTVDGERVWAQGAPYDKDVVNMGLTHGTDQTKVASLNVFLDELKKNPDKYNSGEELYNLSKVDNLKDAYAVAGPRAQKAMVKSITDIYSRNLTNRIQSYTNSGLWTNIKRMFGGQDTSLNISPDTGYVMSGPDAAEINDELAKTQQVLEHFGMGSEEYKEVLKAGLAGTGVQMPEGNYTPSELREKTMENMRRYIAEENAKAAKTEEDARNISPELSNTYREFNNYYKTLEQQVKNGEVDDKEAAAMLRNRFVEVTGTSEAQQETRNAVSDMEYRQYFREQLNKVNSGEITREQANKNLEDFREGKLNEPRDMSINVGFTQADAFAPEDSAIKQQYENQKPFYGEGNIDLNHRNVLLNGDGSFSTENSITITQGNQDVLIPTVVNGKQLSDDEAVQHYLSTGEYLKKGSKKEVEDYANRLHERQEMFYSPLAKSMSSESKAVENATTNEAAINEASKINKFDTTPIDSELYNRISKTELSDNLRKDSRYVSGDNYVVHTDKPNGKGNPTVGGGVLLNDTNKQLLRLAGYKGSFDVGSKIPQKIVDSVSKKLFNYKAQEAIRICNKNGIDLNKHPEMAQLCMDANYNGALGKLLKYFRTYVNNPSKKTADNIVYGVHKEAPQIRDNKERFKWWKDIAAKLGRINK